MCVHIVEALNLQGQAHSMILTFLWSWKRKGCFREIARHRAKTVCKSVRVCKQVSWVKILRESSHLSWCQPVKPHGEKTGRS